MAAQRQSKSARRDRGSKAPVVPAGLWVDGQLSMPNEDAGFTSSSSARPASPSIHQGDSSAQPKPADKPRRKVGKLPNYANFSVHVSPLLPGQTMPDRLLREATRLCAPALEQPLTTDQVSHTQGAKL